MPQSLSKVILHIIFSTKESRALARLRHPPTHARLSCHHLPRFGWQALHVDGVADHVHIVTTLPRTLSQAQLVEQVKKTSSKWIKRLEPCYRRFFWQRGYGAFSVSPSQLDAVLQYVRTQDDHHRSRTFQEEYRELLRKHGVEFDEQYVWD